MHHYSSTSMWSNWNHAVITSNCIYSTMCSIQHWLYTNFIFHCSNINLTQIFPLRHSSTPVSTLSLFLPSRPPPTPACYLHPPLPRAALTHRRTLPLICRLHPRPTPTPVSVSEVDVGLFNRAETLHLCLYVISGFLLRCREDETVNSTTNRLTDSFFFSLSHSGLISPGVSVPVQVPGTEQQSMSQNLGQYWARLQWATDSHFQQA